MEFSKNTMEFWNISMEFWTNEMDKNDDKKSLNSKKVGELDLSHRPRYFKGSLATSIINR